MADRDQAAAQGRCLCAERDLLGDHEEPCAGFGTRSDELCEQAEREAVAAGEWPPESPAAYTPPTGMKSLERKLMQNGDGTHLDPEWAEVRVVMRERTALLTAVEGLLDVGERSRSGDPSLDPEEWYAIRDYARKVLNDAAA